MKPVTLGKLGDKYFLFGSGQTSGASEKEVVALNYWTFGVPVDETKKALHQLNQSKHKKAYFVDKKFASTE